MILLVFALLHTKSWQKWFMKFASHKYNNPNLTTCNFCSLTWKIVHSSQKIIKLSLMFLCLVIISNSLLGFEMIENKSQARKYFQMQKLMLWGSLCICRPSGSCFPMFLYWRLQVLGWRCGKQKVKMFWFVPSAVTRVGLIWQSLQDILASSQQSAFN